MFKQGLKLLEKSQTQRLGFFVGKNIKNRFIDIPDFEVLNSGCFAFRM